MPTPADSPIPIANAGLVLVNPFLPQFFKRLDLLVGGDAGAFEWRSPAAQGRAVHLLQWLVEGRCDRPAPMLALNRLLCGQQPGDPDMGQIEPTVDELAICRSLLDAVIADWPMMKGSSVAALQESFFQRQGKLGRQESAWLVQVERKILDVLVDHVPWSFATIYHRWMSEPVRVNW
ncbi:MAG TPA: contractile injection system tape measure protein [Allosphingosinicella sp.]